MWSLLSPLLFFHLGFLHIFLPCQKIHNNLNEIHFVNPWLSVASPIHIRSSPSLVYSHLKNFKSIDIVSGQEYLYTMCLGVDQQIASCTLQCIFLLFYFMCFCTEQLKWWNLRRYVRQSVLSLTPAPLSHPTHSLPLPHTCTHTPTLININSHPQTCFMSLPENPSSELLQSHLVNF